MHDQEQRSNLMNYLFNEPQNAWLEVAAGAGCYVQSQCAM